MSVLAILVVLLPAAGLLWLVWRTDRQREPLAWVIGTALLGLVLGGVAFFLREKVAQFTHLDVDVHTVGTGFALVYMFAWYAPVGEAAKVAACWPAFQSRHFDEPYDGVVYASAAALGFATIESALLLHEHPHATGVWIARVLFALPAHVFFASAWGWGLGRARQLREPGAYFPMLFLLSVAGHGLYAHIVYGRGPTALVAALPFVLAMGAVAFFLARDLRKRSVISDRSRITTLSIASLEALSKPPSLRAFRDALKQRQRPIVWRWVAYGAVVHLGGMFLGVAGAILLGHVGHVDFSVVDEHDVSTAGPVALLVAGILAGFPVAGYLVARAGELPSLFESAASASLALLAILVVLGVVAPVAVVFALALAPIALGLSALGALVGREEEAR
ncbi:MAG TPA: PrsW family glutamic-type intramembrane protease [Polyangiaceae bacterium]